MLPPGIRRIPSSRTAVMMVLALLVAAAALAIRYVPAEAQGGEQKALVSGWYEDRQVRYYDFGTNTPLAGGGSVPTAPIYAFIYGMNPDGTPEMVEGQHNIVDVLPGETGYSDLWQVNFVVVPRDYEPDSIRSKDEIDAAGLEIMPTDMLVNCPIVPAGTTLEGGEPLVQGWARGEAVFYPDFGANPATTAPIYVLIRGMNADGTPQMVEGQNNIIDTVPGDPDYTAFWRVTLVTVGPDYEANSIRSAADVLSGGFAMMETDMVVNCPVTQVASVSAAPDAASGPSSATGGPSALPSTGDGASAAAGDGGGQSMALLLALGGAGALTAAAGAGLLARRRWHR